MTVHMVRVCIEAPNGEAANAVDNWVTNHTVWESDPVNHTLGEVTVPPDGTTYLRGNYRFVQDVTATALLDDLESRLQSLQNGRWYRIGYHACDHHPLDEPPTPCSWEQTREHGTVPSDIPTFD